MSDDPKENTLLAFKQNITTVRTELGINTFKRAPTEEIDVTEDGVLTCVFMDEGADRIIKRSSRDFFGYPCRRSAEIIFEYIALKSVDLKQFNRNMREVILRTPNSEKGAIFREQRTVGPFGYREAAGVRGMRFILELQYTDIGG